MSSDLNVFTTEGNVQISHPPPFDNSFREALIKSTCADLRQKFLLTRKKIAGILTDFKIF